MRRFLTVVGFGLMVLPLHVGAKDVECSIVNAESSCVSMDNVITDNGSFVIQSGQRLRGNRLCVWVTKVRASDGGVLGVTPPSCRNIGQ